MKKQNDPNAVNDSFLQDVIDGLARMDKTLPCKYFYDEIGSQLFEQITETEEYYPTRIEMGLMVDHIQSISIEIGAKVMLVEFGSGSSTKTRVLLDALADPVAYVPLDISEEHLLNTAENLRLAYPDLEVLPVVADFTQKFFLPSPSRAYSHCDLYFPGSTIGNFEPPTARILLSKMAQLLGPRGGLLVGIDLQKDSEVLERAYNDAAGITAEFNLNLLARINSELGANFDLEQFEHRAIYNQQDHRIEMLLVSQCEQSVNIADQSISFSRDETIVTEYSYKYTVSGFAELAADAGFSLRNSWTDDQAYFALVYLTLQ